MCLHRLHHYPSVPAALVDFCVLWYVGLALAGGSIASDISLSSSLKKAMPLGLVRGLILLGRQFCAAGGYSDELP